MGDNSKDTVPGARLVVFCGPTASGKTRAAVTLALKTEAEIVSADSIQVYRGLNIGSAKPSDEELRRVAHHLLDVIGPDGSMTAALYGKLARRAVADIRSRGRRVVVAGGTGLYIKALVHGLVDAPAADESVRSRLLAMEERSGPGTLHRRLSEADPEGARRLHPSDLVRIVRALEVFELTGRPLTRLQDEHGFGDSPFDVRYVGLDPGPERLAAMIRARVEQMLRSGLKEEVQGLLESGYAPGLRPMQSPGYRQMVAHLKGEMTIEEAADSICRDHRQYARRQRVWFRAVPEVDWREGPEDVDYEGLALWLKEEPGGERHAGHR